MQLDCFRATEVGSYELLGDVRRVTHEAAAAAAEEDDRRAADTAPLRPINLPMH